MSRSDPRASFLSASFLQNALYTSLDNDAAEIPGRRQTRGATEDVTQHMGSSQNVFVADSLALLDQSRYATSPNQPMHRPRKPQRMNSPPTTQTARSLIGMLDPRSRHYTHLQNDLFEQEEEEENSNPRGRSLSGRTTPTLGDPRKTMSESDEGEPEDDPPQSIMYHQSNATDLSPELKHNKKQASASRSPSASPSRSPPLDFVQTRFESDEKTKADRKGKGKGRMPNESDSPVQGTFTATQNIERANSNSAKSPWPLQAPESPTQDAEDNEPAEPLYPGLRLGGRTPQWPTFAMSVPARSNLSRKQRALWTWANATDLDAFLSEVYLYYIGKGIWCIGLDRLLNLLTVGFVIGFSTFLWGCVDYDIIRQKHSLHEVVIDRCVSRFHPGTLLVVVAFSAFYIWRILRFTHAISRFWAMHEFFEELLGVAEPDIQTVPWHTIVNRLADLRIEHPTVHAGLHPHPAASVRMDAHDVANRVMRETNYMIALYNRDVLDLNLPLPPRTLHRFPLLKGGHLTQSLEWNVRFCLMRFLFGPDGKVRRSFLSSANREELVEGLRRRFVLMGFINAVLAPFLILYLLIYSFFRYFQEYHKNPSSIGLRSFTEIAKWQFREYNELPHVFSERLHLAHPVAISYLEQFPKAKTAAAARFIAFVAGSFASVLVLFSLLDPDAFLHFEITKDRSVLFYIGIFGTILAVARGMVPEEHRVMDPERLMLEISEHTHWLPDEWRGRLHSTQVHAAFSSLFQMKIIIFCTEILSVITTPFVLWYTLPKCAPRIIDFFREYTVHVDGLGYVCSFGVFDFKRQGEAKPTQPTNTTSKANKLDKSMVHFKTAHPDWQPREQTSSLYLSQLQSHLPEPTARSRVQRRFGPPSLASTTLMAEETARQEIDARAIFYDRAYARAKVNPANTEVQSSPAYAQSLIAESINESAFEESYDDAKSNVGQQEDRQESTGAETNVVGLLREAYSSTGNKRW